MKLNYFKNYYWMMVNYMVVDVKDNFDGKILVSINILIYVYSYYKLNKFHLDTIGNETDKPHDDDGEIYLDDEADEEKWRKMRYEREIFLKKVRLDNVVNFLKLY